MKKTREQIQSEALEALRKNGYTGTCVIDTGGGKSKVGIDAIKEGKFRNVLITSPRTNLKNNWKQELNKWDIIDASDVGENNSYKIIGGDFIHIDINNIQTVYKWGKDLLKYDLIIADEIHYHSLEYSAYLNIAKSLNIPIIGLTATPNKEDKFKSEVLYSLVPIIYEYYNSEKDGVINKVNFYVWEYELDDQYKVLAGNKNKQWFVGERKQHEYLNKQYEEAKRTMFLMGATDYFTTALTWMRVGNSEQKKAGAKFFYAIKNRKDFLWTLNSSSSRALILKNQILKSNPDNKVLLFSELTSQANRLSRYSIHSNNGKTAKETKEYNQKLLSDFNEGKIRELSSCLSLTLGLNMSHANWAIFESYSSSETNSRQKKGRLNRLTINEIANVVIIKPIGTQVETWFESAFGWIEDYTVINDIKELNL